MTFSNEPSTIHSQNHSTEQHSTLGHNQF